VTTTKRPTFGLQSYSGLYLWALFIVIFGVLKPDLFLTSATVHSIASSQAVLAMLALALLIPLTAGVYDLSVGAVVNFSTIFVVVLQTKHGQGMWTAMAMSVGVCTLIGVINGFVVVKLKVNSFVATLGMATIVVALQLIVSDQSQPLPPASIEWRNLTQSTILGFQVIIYYVLILAVIVWWVLDRTPAGRYLYAIGSNAEAARLTGIAIGRWSWLSLIASAAISGVAGVLYASLSGPSLTYGQSLLLPAFAAVFLGSTQIKPGRANTWGTVMAVYVLATGVFGLQFVTGAQWINNMFNGVALIAAVSFAVWRQTRVSKGSAVSAAEATRLRSPDAHTPQEKDEPTAAATQA
jgi:ribose transport system permease protein